LSLIGIFPLSFFSICDLSQRDYSADRVIRVNRKSCGKHDSPRYVNLQMIDDRVEGSESESAEGHDGPGYRQVRELSLKKKRDKPTATFRSTAELRALYRAEREVKKSGLGRVIASRILTERNARNSKITIMIGAPRRVEADHWLCPYLIKGIVETDIQYGYGVDALQALIVALGGIRADLDRTERRFIWFGDDHGIPGLIPADYGAEAERRIGIAIQRESKRAMLAQVQARKAEISSAEAEVKALKKGASRWREPAGKENIEAEIVRREARIKVAKKRTAEWEAELRAWKPDADPKSGKNTASD
jgi:hypothetical protein